jgi:hypothetical protein
MLIFVSKYSSNAQQAPFKTGGTGVQTGSGKTFTMSGREDVLALDDYSGGPTLDFVAGPS